MAASRVQQVLSKVKSAVEPAYNMVRSQTLKQYDTIMANNAQYVVKDKEAGDKLLKQWVFTNLARIPTEIATAKNEAAVFRSRLSNFRDLPVPEMATYVGFAAEIYAWFAIGEIIGRGGSLNGYSV